MNYLAQWRRETAEEIPKPLPPCQQERALQEEIQKDKITNRRLSEYNEFAGYELVSRIRQQLQETTCSVLDVGCGKGVAIRELRQQFLDDRLTITGVDVRPPQIDMEGITFLQIDLQHFRPKEKYDIITGMYSLIYVRNPLSAIATLYNSLVPTGVFYMTLRPNLIKIDGDRFGEKSDFFKKVQMSGGVIKRWPLGNQYVAFKLTKGNEQIDLPKMTYRFKRESFFPHTGIIHSEYQSVN